MITVNYKRLAEKIVLAVCGILIVLLIYGNASAKYISIKKDGSGQFKTIQNGIDAATAGDTIEIFSGTYAENVVIVNKKGSSTNRYTLKVADGEAVIIDGRDTDHCINLSNSSFWTIDGIEMIRGNFAGIRAYNSPNTTIRNCVIHDIRGFDGDDGNTGIYFASGCDNSEIYSNKVYDMNPDEGGKYGINIQNSDYVKIHDNEVYEVTYSIRAVRGSGYQIYNNYAHDSEGNIWQEWAIYIRDTQNTLVYNNILETRTSGIHVYSYGAQPSINGKIYNNTVNGSNSGISFNGSSTGFQIKNNIFLNCNAGIYFDGTGHIYDYNLFFGCDENVNGGGNSDGGHNFISNPNLTGEGVKPNPYYSLAQINPCGDGGINDDSDMPDTDFAGNTRDGNQWIGAFEYLNGSPDLRPNPPTGLRVVN